MFTINQSDYGQKPAFYASLEVQLRALLESERDFIANAANFSSLLYHTLPQLNWVGIYRSIGTELVLGPFQGKPACTRIASGRGVCGAAMAQQKTILVLNVHEFPGHIACDSASQSEIVVPLLYQAACWGVLDLDSPVLSRFDQADQAGLERLRDIFMSLTTNPSIVYSNELSR